MSLSQTPFSKNYLYRKFFWTHYQKIFIGLILLTMIPTLLAGSKYIFLTFSGIGIIFALAPFFFKKTRLEKYHSLLFNGETDLIHFLLKIEKQEFYKKISEKMIFEDLQEYSISVENSLLLIKNLGNKKIEFILKEKDYTTKKYETVLKVMADYSLSSLLEKNRMTVSYKTKSFKNIPLLQKELLTSLYRKEQKKSFYETEDLLFALKQVIHKDKTLEALSNPVLSYLETYNTLPLGESEKDILQQYLFPNLKTGLENYNLVLLSQTDKIDSSMLKTLLKEQISLIEARISLEIEKSVKHYAEETKIVNNIITLTRF